MEHSELIEKFYIAFQDKDAKGMTACYHKDLSFEDAAFGALDYTRACGMWRMLLSSSEDLDVTFNNVQSNDTSGSVQWEAKYTFSKTRRKVHNKINARFKFKDGLIIEHKDDFSFHKWSRMALGISGALLGWTSFLQNKVRVQATESLDKYLKK